MSFGRRFCPIRRGRDILKTNRLSKTVCVNSRVTKAQVILLPHLRDRPVTLKRYPNGALGEYPNSAFRRQHSTCWVVSANANWRYCVTFCAESSDEHSGTQGTSAIGGNEDATLMRPTPVAGNFPSKRNFFPETQHVAPRVLVPKVND